MASPLRRKLGIIAGLAVMVLILGFVGRVWVALHQDKIWALKVRRKLDVEEARRWVLSTRKFYSPTNDYRAFANWLTNAPKLLVDSYRRPPMVLAQEDDSETYFVSLRYGGGMYDWGITIGETNLPPTRGRGAHVENWAPGINFWNN